MAAAAALTLPHGALDVAHDQAVLIVQELDAHLGDLQSTKAEHAYAYERGGGGSGSDDNVVVSDDAGGAWGRPGATPTVAGTTPLLLKLLAPQHAHTRADRGSPSSLAAQPADGTPAPPHGRRTWPRLPVRPMTFITMASFTGVSCMGRASGGRHEAGAAAGCPPVHTAHT